MMNCLNHQTHCSFNRIRVVLAASTLCMPPEHEGGDGP